MNHTEQQMVVQLTTGQLQELIREGVEKALQSESGKGISSTTERAWMTREETAKHLHVSFPTLRRYEREGVLKPTRIRRRVLYAVADVENLLKEGYSNQTTTRRKP